MSLDLPLELSKEDSNDRRSNCNCAVFAVSVFASQPMLTLRLIAITLLLALATLAQTDRGTITGTVQDPDGAMVSGVMVIAWRTASGTKSETTTTATGQFHPARRLKLYSC